MLVNALTLLFAIFASIAAVPVDDFSKGISNFATDFYQQIVQKESGNVIMSPYSVANALVLLSQASGGKSLEEITKVLNLSGEKSSIADQFFGYYGLLKESAGDSILSVANEIFVQQGNNLNKNFQEVATNKLLSGVDSVDFAKPAEAVQTINQFVQTKTNNKIQNLFNADDVSGASAVLVNAIYMKAKWQNSFESYKTSEQEFYTSETDKAVVNFMHNTDRFNYGNLTDLDASALELKYYDSDLALLVLLPNSQTGLTALESKLKDYDLSNVAGQLKDELVKVAIPKFKIDYAVDLKDILIKMGVADIFGDNADLSGLLEGGQSVAISDAIHKAYIEVNEEGTEAAGATGAVAIPISAMFYPENTPKFYADHPFVYFIWDTKTQSVLFSGHITKPNSA